MLGSIQARRVGTRWTRKTTQARIPSVFPRRLLPEITDRAANRSTCPPTAPACVGGPAALANRSSSAPVRPSPPSHKPKPTSRQRTSTTQGDRPKSADGRCAHKREETTRRRQPRPATKLESTAKIPETVDAGTPRTM